jgi:hypothetical protein
MKIRNFLSCLLTMFALALFGCGGGSGGDNDAPIASTTINGVASKGMFVSGTVKFFALNNEGLKGTLLATAPIEAGGTYTAVIAHEGPVLAEASGEYKDEATGEIKTVAETSPLRAAIRNAAGEVTVAITPLTEIAVKKIADPVSGKINVTSIDAMNKHIADLFHLADITGTLPVDATADDSASATDERQKYALVLAAISQMTASGSSLDQVLTQLHDAIDVAAAQPAMNSETAAELPGLQWFWPARRNRASASVNS